MSPSSPTLIQLAEKTLADPFFWHEKPSAQWQRVVNGENVVMCEFEIELTDDRGVYFYAYKTHDTNKWVVTGAWHDWKPRRCGCW